MNRQQNLTGRVSVVNDDNLAQMAHGEPAPYPLGMPRRVLDAVKRELEAFAQAVDDMLGTRTPPLEVTHMTPSDVPGVLIAAGIDEILASLGRIQRAQGFESSDRAYRAILGRALADGRDDVARQMTACREQLVRAREWEAKQRPPGLQAFVSGPSTRVRDLMQQKADEAQAQAQAAKLAERDMNAAKAKAFNEARDGLGYRGKSNYGQH